MNKPKCFFVCSAYQNDVSWLYDYAGDDNYVIYDKSNSLPQDKHIIKIDDVGMNGYDYCHFIVNNYDNLPPLIALIQGEPWPHIAKSTFDKLIYNECFTPLEDYTQIPYTVGVSNDKPDTFVLINKRDSSGGYLEINNSWYLNLPLPWEHRYFLTYDDFMETLFLDYKPVSYVRFAPGLEYLVTRENILFYSKSFYKLMMEMTEYSAYPAEACLFERASFAIFSNQYKENLEATKEIIE